MVPQIGSSQLRLHESLNAEKMVDALNYADTQSRKNVKNVFLAKCRRSPFQNRSNTGQPEIVRSDVCEPMQVESKGGSKYMLIFKDDFSQYTTAYFI